MQHITSKSSVHSFTSSSSDGNASFIAHFMQSTEELFYQLCGRISYYNTLTVLSYLMETISLIALCLDPSFSWGNTTTKALNVFQYFRGLHMNSIPFLPSVIIFIIISLIPVGTVGLLYSKNHQKH